jgi:hypothetical protein
MMSLEMHKLVFKLGFSCFLANFPFFQFLHVGILPSSDQAQLQLG